MQEMTRIKRIRNIYGSSRSTALMRLNVSGMIPTGPDGKGLDPAQ